MTIAEANAARAQLTDNATVLQQSVQRMELKSNNTTYAVFDSSTFNPQISAADDIVMTLNDRKYRGRIEFVRYTGGKMTAVNVLPVNEYLYSAIPSEMYSSWHKEALKAQAVAGRNYCITRFGIHKDIKYDLCDTTHCQAYNGFNNEAASSNAAVDETSNILIYYNGQPINAVFFSSSGGHTESSENVWVSAEPYLRGVKDEYEKEFKTWTRNFTVADIETILSKNSVNIGRVTDIRAVKHTDSGRVDELQIIGSSGVKSLKKEEIRTFFRVHSSGSLESRLFTINGVGATTNSNGISTITSNVTVQGENLTAERNISEMFAVNSQQTPTQLSETEISAISSSSSTTIKSTNQTITRSVTSATGDFYFQGRGYGHGVGMSQYGAKGMAEAGFDFIQILKHYYTGVDIM